jgi:hypothetical protein
MIELTKEEVELILCSIEIAEEQYGIRTDKQNMRDNLLMKLEAL